MSVIGLNISDLSKLMPMHVSVGADGRIVSAGATVKKIVGDAAVFHDVFACYGKNGREAQRDDVILSLKGENRIFLVYRKNPDIILRGNSVAARDGTVLVNLGFGISLEAAIRTFNLTNTDFTQADLAMEFLFLKEANRAAMSELSRVNERLKRAQEDAKILSVTDSLTGLLNRRGFERELAHAVAMQDQDPFSLLHLDLDNFKTVNDTLGHAAGDLVLKRVAEIIRSEVRSTDKVCRAGGDEFLVLLFSMKSKASILNVCNRIIHNIEAISDEVADKKISASIGVFIGQMNVPVDRDAYFTGADAALYRAKCNGRGRAVISD